MLIANIAHAGDGNLHPLLITPPGDEPARIRAQQAFEEILTEAIDRGRHGHRRARGRAAEAGRTARELSPAVVELHRAVRRALDPYGILNPGKVIEG